MNEETNVVSLAARRLKRDVQSGRRPTYTQGLVASRALRDSFLARWGVDPVVWDHDNPGGKALSQMALEDAAIIVDGLELARELVPDTAAVRLVYWITCTTRGEYLEIWLDPEKLVPGADVPSELEVPGSKETEPYRLAFFIGKEDFNFVQDGTR